MALASPLVQRAAQPMTRPETGWWSYVPALDRVCTFGTAVLWNNGQRALMQTLCFDQQTRLWERKAPPLTARTGSWTALDLVTGHIWQHGTIVTYHLAEYDPVADTWTKRSGNYGQYEYYTTAVIDPVHRQLVVVPGCRGSGMVTCPSMPARLYIRSEPVWSPEVAAPEHGWRGSHRHRCAQPGARL